MLSVFILRNCCNVNGLFFFLKGANTTTRDNRGPLLEISNMAANILVDRDITCGNSGREVEEEVGVL